MSWWFTIKDIDISSKKSDGSIETKKGTIKIDMSAIDSVEIFQDKTVLKDFKGNVSTLAPEVGRHLNQYLQASNMKQYYTDESTLYMYSATVFPVLGITDDKNTVLFNGYVGSEKDTVAAFTEMFEKAVK